MNTSTALASAAPKTGFDQALREASILVIDDEPGMRNFLDRTLRPRCRHLDLAASVEEATGLLDAAHFDIVILDNIMGGKRGVDWLAEQRDTGFLPAAILITAYADLETAIQALQAGAADFVLKPFRSNQILNAVARCLDRMQLQRENTVLRHELKASSDLILLRDKLIGESPAIEDIRATIARVAPLPSSVLLTGQSGTGKEVAARMIHELSDRAAKPFVPVNCAAMPSDMVESELFGHVKGAFTGAQNGREGLFLHARGGTLFLDEIGDLPLPTQGKLLRVLEDRKVRPVGAERELPVDLRFVFATNVDLEKAVAEGRFRADLFFRINIVSLHMPPLKERGRDALDLADLFMQKLSLQLGTPPLPLTEEVRRAIAAYDWPGNVRELRNFIERSLILGRFPPDFLRTAPTPSMAGQPSGSGPAPEAIGALTLADMERSHILGTLERCGGDRDAAASLLGISRKTIDRRLRDWNV